MKVKVLKDYLGRKGAYHKAGETQVLASPKSKLTSQLLAHGFIAILHSDYNDWEKNGIRSKLTNLIIAPEDYTEGDKKHFAFDEALEIERKLPDGWRLPTRSEWVLICEEFGQEDGELDTDTLVGNLNLHKNGRVGGYGSLNYAGSDGYYWSRTSIGSTYAYHLYFGSGNFDPGTNSSYRYYGFSVRCVKEVK